MIVWYSEPQKVRQIVRAQEPVYRHLCGVVTDADRRDWIIDRITLTEAELGRLTDEVTTGQVGGALEIRLHPDGTAWFNGVPLEIEQKGSVPA